MARREDTPRDLILGLLALQIRMIDRDELVAAFGEWSRGEGKSMADILVGRGSIDEAGRTLLSALADKPSEPDGDDTRKLPREVTQDRPTLEMAKSFGDDDSGSSTDEVGSHTPFFESKASSPVAVGLATGQGQRYRVLRLHAKGGLGAVFVALDGELNREVALKQIRPERADDSQSRARFQQEAEITGRLEHPGIVPVYGLGRDPDGRLFYAMRFIRGDSLKEAVAKFQSDGTIQGDVGLRSLELRKLLDRFLDVCDAIDYAHSRGVLHRDLKPSNVMLGDFGETLVVDWGLAKSLGGPEMEDGSEESGPSQASDYGLEATQVGFPIGTPAYMPPEQAAGRLEELGFRSDVYSLGATLYALLTGKAPFPEADLATMIYQVQEGRYPPPRAVKPWIDPALDAICRKAMARGLEERYESARALAEDVRKWLADEPTSAWREPIARKLTRWARRNRTLVTSVGVATVVGLLAVSYGFYQAVLRANYRLTAANGRVDALWTAEVRAIPLILEQLRPDRDVVEGRLRAMAGGKGLRADDRGRLPGSLALADSDRSQAAFLIGRVLKPEASPEEVLVIRSALAGSDGGADLVETFRRALTEAKTPLDDAQLRAAGVLAQLSPTDPAWPGLASALAGKLSGENSLLIDDWREVFQPISAVLIPPLRAIYADRSRPDPRERAFVLLLEFATQPGNPNRPEDLAALLPEADATRREQVLARLASRPDRSRAIEVLSSVTREVTPMDDAKAARRARAASALMRLGEDRPVWPLLAFHEDPGARTELIHDLPASGVGPRAVLRRLGEERDVSTRRALILCLGGFPPGAIPEAERTTLEAELLGRYRTDPDPGVHGAIDWLLRRDPAMAGRLAEADRALASPDPHADRDWFINGQSQTFSIVRGPVEFLMGSTPETDPDRQADETLHRRRIPRSFAIGSREVTVAEYGVFLESRPEEVADRRQASEFHQYIPTPDCAMGHVTWFEAARYCNWLSAREGIAEADWCYPRDWKPGSRLPADHLEREGYRLATEAEWEYACRSGSSSSRYYGRAEARLGEYGWFGDNSGSTMHPAGRKKPNDLGLFDMLGNAVEWCGAAYKPYPPMAGGRAFVDSFDATDLDASARRSLRGGTFFFPASFLRSAYRNVDSPTNDVTVLGFRVARTVP